MDYAIRGIKIEKIDIHNRKNQYLNAVQKLETDTSMNKQNKLLILKFIRDCKLGKTLKKRQKKRIGVARRLKYIQILKKISAWLDKPFDKVEQEDIEKIIEALDDDKFKYEVKSNTGKLLKTGYYAYSTKLDYKKTIKKFYKWLLGNNDYYPELVEWIETYDIPKEIPALRREEIEKLVTASKVRDKAIIMFLFDSGARAEEFLNIRIGDLSKNGDIYKVRIVHSKTKPRTISIPMGSKYLELWLEEYGEKDEQGLLFPISYDGMRTMLHRTGKKVLNKKVIPHILRHSSATYYTKYLNHFQLCYRYGWSMTSKMPDRYIDREGMFEEDTPVLVKTNDLSVLEKQNQELKEEISLMKENNSQTILELGKLKKNMNTIYNGKNFMKLLISLSNQQRQMAKELKNITGKKFDVVLPRIS